MYTNILVCNHTKSVQSNAWKRMIGDLYIDIIPNKIIENKSGACHVQRENNKGK